MHITDKKRFITFLVIVFICISFIYNHVIARTNVEAEPSYTYIDYVVTGGETLWAIASKYTTNDEDIRNKIAEIKKDNEISSNIYEGQTIKIKKNLINSSDKVH